MNEENVVSVENIVSVEDFIAAITSLKEKLPKIKALDDIISEVLAGEKKEEQRRAMRRILKRRSAAQQGNSGVEFLYRAITSQIDCHFEQDIAGVTAEDRSEIVSQICCNVATHVIDMAICVLEYSQAVGELNRVKSGMDGKEISSARMEKNSRATELQRSMQNVYRSCYGDNI